MEIGAESWEPKRAGKAPRDKQQQEALRPLEVKGQAEGWQGVCWELERGAVGTLVNMQGQVGLCESDSWDQCPVRVSRHKEGSLGTGSRVFLWVALFLRACGENPISPSGWLSEPGIDHSWLLQAAQ